MSLAYTVLADSASDGPLVSGISGAQAAYLALTNPAGLVAYVNGQLQAALQSLPEGTRVELTIGGWTLPGIGPVASRAAGEVNSAWAGGQIDYQGEPVHAWPEYPNQVAWGDDSTATVTIRTLVGQWQAVLFVLIGVLVVAAVWVLWDNWSQPSTSWQARSAVPQQPSGVPSPSSVLAWLGRNWPWMVIGAGAAAAAPFVIRSVARVREAENELRYAEGGGF